MLASMPTEPSNRELELLGILWSSGPSTAREVYEAVNARGGAPPMQRTTVLKLLQIMLAKGLVDRDDSVSPQVYRAAWRREQVESRLLRSFVERVFGGSSKDLVARALDGTSPSELEEIRQLIEEAEEGGGGG